MKNLVLISAVALTTGTLIALISGIEIEKPIHSIKKQEHFNMIIVPDLSNRIDTVNKPKPVGDLEIIGGVLDDIYPEFLCENRINAHQQDRFILEFTNQKLITDHNINTDLLSIDISKFKNQIDRIEYLTGKSNLNNINRDIEKLKTEVDNTYDKARADMGGADIPSFLEKLNTSQIKKKGCLKNKKTHDGKTIVQEYRNVIILITDGYIEADKYAKNYSIQKVYPNLSQNRIESFREDFNKRNDCRTVDVFFSEEGYGITPVQNELLKEVEILVLEIDDRSLNESGNSTKEISDYKIIKLFWEDWLTKSGVKRFELFTKASSKSEVQDHVNKFLQINN